MGAMVETLSLQAPNYGFDAIVIPELTRDGQDIFIASIALNTLVEGGPVDPLSKWVSRRLTNRNRYSNEPLTPTLKDDLRQLCNTLVDTDDLKKVDLDASIESWADEQFVHDLEMWLRKDEQAPDGLTAKSMNISGPEMRFLDYTFRRGGFKSRFMGRLLSSSEVSMFASAPTAAVISVPEMTPPAVFDAGRGFLRS